MSRVYRLVVLVFSLVLFLAPLPLWAQPAGEFGRWNFPDAVDAMPKDTHPGQAFNGYPNYKRNIDWMAIPPWMAGDWLSKDYRILKTYDHVKDELQTIPRGTEAAFADHFGDQVDRQGTVWSCNMTPFLTNIQLKPQLVDAQLCLYLRPVDVREEQVALVQRVLHVLYDPQNYTIHDSYTEERVTEFAPTGQSIITAQSTSRFYDPDGNPVYTTNSVRMMRMTNPFQRSNQRNGVDLLASLNEHLQATGRGELCP